MAQPLTLIQQEYFDLLNERFHDFKVAFTQAIKEDNDPAHVNLLEQPALQLATQIAFGRLSTALGALGGGGSPQRVYADGTQDHVFKAPVDGQPGREGRIIELSAPTR